MSKISTEMVDSLNEDFRSDGDRHDVLRYMRDAYDYWDSLENPDIDLLSLPKEDRNRVLEKHKRDLELLDTIGDVVNKLSTAVNSMGRRQDVGKLMAAAMGRHHRTLQAEMIGALLEVFHHYQDSSYDARNADAVFMAGLVDRFMVDVVRRGVVSC